MPSYACVICVINGHDFIATSPTPWLLSPLFAPVANAAEHDLHRYCLLHQCRTSSCQLVQLVVLACLSEPIYLMAGAMVRLRMLLRNISVGNKGTCM